MCLSRIFFVLCLALQFCAPAAALNIEPDSFSSSADLTHAVPGATLSLSMGNGDVRPDFMIVAAYEHGIASTGSAYFGARSNSGFGAQFFLSSASLRIDFQSPMQSVAIDFIGCCGDVPGHPLTTGWLRAFDASGALLGSYTTAALFRNQIETGRVALPQAGIAYVMASTTAESNATYLDNFSAAVPEPASAGLLGFGLLAGVLLRRRVTC